MVDRPLEADNARRLTARLGFTGLGLGLGQISGDAGIG